MSEIISVNNLRKSYGSHQVLSDVSFSFEGGQIIGLLGPNGSGKTSLIKILTGLIHDYSGEVRFDDRVSRVFKVKEWVEIRLRHVAFLFQELRLFPELTAYENVKIKNDLTGTKTREEILNWFERLGIADKVDQKVGLMSFGQQQRVAMMRALAQPFDFILADEPISHLDANNSRIMGEIMMEEAKKQGAGVIVTSIGKHMDLNYEKILKL